MTPMMTLDRASVEHALRETLATVSHHPWPVDGIQAEWESDPGDQIRAAADRAVAAGQLTIESATAHDIEYALAKLDRGVYGVCEQCGRHISRSRLTAVPWARRCLSCQTKAEKELP
jgi:DnaK suppressor protein